MRRLAYERGGEPTPELAMISYGLLFTAIFFAGATALIAVVIAYAQRDAADARIRSHYEFQIKIFWIAFGLGLIAGVCGLAGVVLSLGEVLGSASVTALSPDNAVQIDMSRITLDRRVLTLFGGAGLFALSGFLWLLIAPAFGFIRLASARSMGDSPAR